MNTDYQSNFAVYRALIGRSFKTVKYQLPNTLIDGLLLTSLNVLVFGYLFPAMSMPEALVAPVFLGSLITMFFNLGFTLATRLVRDLKFTRFIDYLLTLPMNKKWLFAYYVSSFIIELTISTTPIVVFGLWALSGKINLMHANWPLFTLVYFLSIMLLAVLFLSISFLYPYLWFIDNIWPRRLTPLVITGSVYAPWERIYQLSPKLGNFFLLNPITYIAEGLRSTLLGGSHFIAAPLCIGALCIWLIASIGLLNLSVKKLNAV